MNAKEIDLRMTVIGPPVDLLQQTAVAVSLLLVRQATAIGTASCSYR